MQPSFKNLTLAILVSIPFGDLPPAAGQDADTYQRYASAFVGMHDKNNDGRLSKSELRAIHRLLNHADKNGDRYVDRSELIEAVKRIPDSQDSDALDKTGNPELEALILKRIEEKRKEQEAEIMPRRNAAKSHKANRSNSDHELYIQHAKRLLVVCDEDKDGRLSRVELNKILNPPQNADQNGDGFVDQAELIEDVIARNSERSFSGRSLSDSKQTGLNELPEKQDASTQPALVTKQPLGSFKSDSDAYERYAKGLIKNYDKDKDQKLSTDELKRMRRPPVNADMNGDGYVDTSELAEAVKRKSNAPINASADRAKQKRPSPPKKMPSEKSELETMILKRIQEKKKEQEEEKKRSQEAAGTAKGDSHEIADRSRDMLAIAKQLVAIHRQQYEQGTINFLDLMAAQQELLEMQLKLAKTKQDRIKILSSQLETAKKMEQSVEVRFQNGDVPKTDVLKARLECMKIELMLKEH